MKINRKKKKFRAGERGKTSRKQKKITRGKEKKNEEWEGAGR
jgi:hypothetical protein